MKIDYNERWNKQKNSHSHHPSVRLRNRFILKQLNNISFNNLIDIGCGDGYLLSLIKNNYPQKKYSGIDISDQTILENENKYKNLGISWYQGDLGKKIDISNTYDIVLCSEVIEHIDDWKQVIDNLSKLTSHKGYCILTTQSGKRYNSDINIGHIKHFSLIELEKEFYNNGLIPIKSYKKGFPFYNLQKWLYDRIQNKAEKIQQSELTFFSKILFNITYFFFLLSIKSKILGPQIFMILQKK